ncbi:MAG TPA: CpaD family pilus assembly protein [Beijerinckiaceae bacterium]|jgi:pilus assembly protein CpaD
MTRPKTRRAFRPLAILLAGLPLSACGAGPATTGSAYPTDYRQRHPIMLAEGARTLDVFINAAHGLDPRQREDVLAFAVEYRRYGQGPLNAQVPGGSGAEIGAHRTLEAVREALEAGGVPGGHLAVSTYLVADPRAASAIRLSFRRLKASVAGRCGLWPHDLGVSDFRSDFNNAPYWNHGCALQSNVAAQISDPVDLVRGRQEGRIDTLRRSKDIDNLRQGKDPSTQYRSDEKGKINQQVGN